MDAELQSFNYYSVIIIRSGQGDKSIWQTWMNEQKLGSMNSAQLHELGVKLGPGGVLHTCASSCTPGFYGWELLPGTVSTVTAVHGFAVDLKGEVTRPAAGEL